MVECSPALKKIQHETLKCLSKNEGEKKLESDVQSSPVEGEQISQISGTPVSWHFELEQVPRGGAYHYLLKPHHNLTSFIKIGEKSVCMPVPDPTV